MRYENRGTMDDQEERQRLFSKKGGKGEHYGGSVSAIG
jgi:hypothetical protein